MNLLYISHWLTFATSLVLGVFVIAQNHRRLVNQTFLFLSIALAAWLLFVGLAFDAKSELSAAHFIRTSSSIAALIPLTFNFLRLAISGSCPNWKSLIRHSRYWLIAVAVIIALCNSPAYVLYVEPAKPGVIRTIAEPVYGWGIFLFGSYMLAALGVLIVLFLRDLRQARGIPRIELQFTLMGCGIGIFIGTLVSVVIPVLTTSSQSVQLSPLSVLTLNGIIAYGIATRRIMAVADILRRVTAYALLTIYLTLLYAAIWTSLRWGLQPWAWGTHVAHLFAALAVAFSMIPASGRLQQFANRLFVTVQSVDATEMLRRANRIFGTITTRDELLRHFADLVSRSVGTDHVAIYLREQNRYDQVYPDSTPPRPVLPLDCPLVSVLASSEHPLATEAFHRHRAEPMEQQANNQMTALGASLAIGIHAKEELKGFVLLGPRLSGRIYGVTEQSALQVLCNQFAVGLENADLYTQVKDSAIYNDILLDSVVTGIIAVNRDGLITICNREAHRLLDAPPGSLTKNSIDKLPRALAAALRATIDHDSGSRNVETTIKTADADARPIRFSTAPFSSHTGKQLGALLVMEDLTALKKLENQIRRTDRLASIGTLSAGMAHEIKNPLVTLKTFTDLLPERYQDADFRDTFSSLVGQEVKRIDSIVNQLLRFARPAKPSLHPTRIHDVLDNTLRLVHQQLKQKQIQLVREYEAPNDLIQGDSDLLVQAFLNFFLNAIDAMEREGVLTIRTDFAAIETNQLTLGGGIATETRLRVAIRDNGVGIKPEDLPHVFDPFFTTKSTGTGLGLSVSHGIISEHRGIMDVESVLGAGSTFYILFPVATVEVPA